MNFYKETPRVELSEYDIEFFKIAIKEMHFIANAHIHSAIEFLYITKGHFQIQISGVSKEAQEGDLVLIPSNAIHSVYHSDDGHGEYYVIKLTIQYLLSIFKGIENYDCLLSFFKCNKDCPIIFKSREIPCKTKGILEKMICEYTSGDNMMLSAEKAYTCIFVISVYRELLKQSYNECNAYITSDTITLIYEILEYMHLNYASDITALECAKKINLSYSYFAKLFRSVCGKSFKEYLIDIRMAKAYNILLATDLPITDIALSTGYNNHAYFTAEYRKHYGKTPRETRNMVSEQKK